MALTLVKGNMIEDGAVTSGQLAATSITSATILDNTIANVKMAVDPSDASTFNAGNVPLAQLGNVPVTTTTTLQNDIALLGFKAAANGSLAKYNLVDQTVDAFEDATGVDAGSSTDATRNASKYYSGTSTAAGTATGGTVTTHGSYTVHSFLTDANFVVGGGGTGANLAVMMVGGGGSGGRYHGGGAGAGGIIQGTGWSLSPATYPVVVGAGGLSGTGWASSPATESPNGDDTTFASQTAKGGGGGGSYNAANAPNPYAKGRDGGSGGGADGGQYGATVWDLSGGTGTQPAPSGQPGTGHAYDGGTSRATSTHAGSGGGGAGEVGENETYPAAAGDGGDGIQNDYRTGSNVWYGGGGGGGQWSTASGGTGGQGGGGAGESGVNTGNGGDGTANTGGGGGGFGGNSNSYRGGNGGSGIVVIRYVTGSLSGTSIGDMTLVSNLTAAQAAPTKGDIVFTYTNGAGTTVINTNVTAEVSADNGLTWTLFSGLTSQGTTGGHTIVTAHEQTITSTITSPWNMRYRIKTLVQSAALDTRIQAVSLGWS